VAKRPTPDTTALTVQERVLLFCVGTGTDWQRAGVLSEVVTEMMVAALISRDGLGRLALATGGRDVLQALVLDL
jgi:hypothetical protein